MATFKSFITVCFLSLITPLMAQTPHRCGTMEYLDLQMQQDPGLAARMAADEINMQQYMSAARVSTAPVVIRVVVHVVWNTAVQNISDTQILSQIDVLNEDFSRTNIDTVNTPSVFLPVASSPNIHFCMATEDPNGNPTNGIVRVQTNVTAFPPASNDVKFNSSGGSDAWDPNTYLNLWVCNLGGGLLGYAQFPGGNLLTSGVVFQYYAFGRTGTLQAPYNLGRNATHEIGHFLNLRHIWGDANCGNDLVADTPVQQQSNFMCPSFPQITCSNGPNGDMFMNYMDYSDDICMNMFTAGQSARMHAAIALNYQGLLSNIDCIPYMSYISGKVFYDSNQNGLEDTGEPGMINHNVMLMPDNILLTTNNNGIYTALVDSGSYTVTLQTDTAWNLTSSPASYSVIVDSNAVCCNDFGLFPLTIFDDASISFTPVQYRCGDTIPSGITLTNTGTSVLSGTIRHVHDDLMDFISSSPPPDITSGDTLFFDYNNLAPGNSIFISLLFGIPITEGIQLCSGSLALIYDGTINQPFIDNTYCDTVTCSWDPNDKQVIPPGVQAAHFILKTDSLQFTIRFQNEGSDTAFAVVIRDQLSNLLDRNTIELISSSHPVTLSVNSSGLAEFRFDDIELPHKAVNEPGSNGYVRFRILPFPGLPDGTVINNNAGIYFDYNPAVITNTTFVTLVTTIPVGINEVSGPGTVIISPQPFTNYCDITITSEKTTPESYEIYDVSGKIISAGITSPGQQKHLRLQTSEWNRGVYFIRILEKNGEWTNVSRLVKQ